MSQLPSRCTKSVDNARNKLREARVCRTPRCVLTAIASDDIGKEALAQVHTIELAAAPQAEVMKEQRGFLVRAPKLLTEPFTHATLRRELEKHL